MSDLLSSRRASAHRMIQRWGGLGYLVRGNVQRVATMAELEYSVRERGLFADKSVRMRISCIGLAIPPDHDLDQVLYKGNRYNILLPPDGPRVSGGFVYYDCNSIVTQSADTPS